MKTKIVIALASLVVISSGLNTYFVYKLNSYDKILTQAVVDTNQYTHNLDVIIANMIELQPVLKDDLITRLGQQTQE